MTEITLILPMAGRGSRFSKEGQSQPKPLIELHGRPFFWWATQSIAAAVGIREIIAIILKEHDHRFGIGDILRAYYPDIKLVILPETTTGAAETAAYGIRAMSGDGVIAINDCDHAFLLNDSTEIVRNLHYNSAGYLVGFRSDKPAYSYVIPSNNICGSSFEIKATVEKKVVSPHAIAGCYFFSSPAVFLNSYSVFKDKCIYQELFISGLYNILCEQGETVLYQELLDHISFGTPEELELVNPIQLEALVERGQQNGKFFD